MSARLPLIGDRGIDDARERLNASLLGVPVMYKFSTSFDKSLTEGGVVPQPEDRECERLWVVGLHKKGLLFVHEDLGDRSDTRGYDGCAGNESFQRDAAKAFVDASWVDDDIGGGEKVRDRVDESSKHDVLANAELIDDIVELFAVCEINRARMRYADDEAVCIGAQGQDVRQRSDSDVLPPSLRDAAHNGQAERAGRDVEALSRFVAAMSRADRRDPWIDSFYSPPAMDSLVLLRNGIGATDNGV